MNSPAPLNGLVLAGGRSRRFGQDKAALTVQGKAWLQRAVDLLTPPQAEEYPEVVESAVR